MSKDSRKSWLPNLRLRRQREERGWSQAFMAQAIEADDLTVSRWERGVSRPGPHFRARLRELFQLGNEELGLQVEEGLNVEPSPRPSSMQKAANPPLFPPIYDPAIPLLPRQMRELVGREQLLLRMKTLLLAPQRPGFFALKGLPGAGKTALASFVVRDADILAQFGHGILWATMGPRPELQEILTEWGYLLALTPSEIAEFTSMVTGVHALHTAIGERSMLIVLDDVWKIEDVFALKVGGPNCVYLLTTRFPKVAALFAHEQTEVVYELDEKNGIELVARFVPDVVAQEREAVRMLVHATGGLPLALTVIGSYLQLQAHDNQPRRIGVALRRLQDAKERLRLI